MLPDVLKRYGVLDELHEWKPPQEVHFKDVRLQKLWKKLIAEGEVFYFIRNQLLSNIILQYDANDIAKFSADRQSCAEVGNGYIVFESKFLIKFSREHTAVQQYFYIKTSW